jgi:hypothetical protein
LAYKKGVKEENEGEEKSSGSLNPWPFLQLKGEGLPTMERHNNSDCLLLVPL